MHLADSRAETTFPAHHSQHPACLPPSLLVSAIVARPPHKPHRRLTNRMNAPAAINRASRIPATGEMPTIRALVRSSAFLRRSDTQPEEKFVHRTERHHRRCFGVAIASYLGVMLSSKLHQEEPRPGEAGGARASKLPSWRRSALSKHFRAASVGTNGKYSHAQFGSAGVPWFTSWRVTTRLPIIPRSTLPLTGCPGLKAVLVALEARSTPD